MSGFLNSFSPIVAGNSGTTVVQFVLPSGTNAAGGSIQYELVDPNGIVYTSGTAIGYSVTTSPNSVQANATVVLSVPSNIPVNLLGTAYQVSMTLNIPGKSPVLQTALVTIQPNTMVYTGASDIVCIKGTTAKLQLVLPEDFPTVTANFYKDNDIINPTPPSVTGPVVTSDGYAYSINLVTQQIPASLEPYGVIWQYGASATDLEGQEQSSVYVITQSMIQAAKDLQLRINKARTSIGDKPTFDITEMFSYMRRGMDWFNSVGITTSFTMTNAKFGTREYWLKFSEVIALRSQYMFEGETAFDFQGQAISLNVDRSQYYEGLASAIESEAMEPTRQYKDQLGKRGNINGDGSADPNSLRKGAIGSLGISLTPVSNLRLGNPNAYFFGIRPFW